MFDVACWIAALVIAGLVRYQVVENRVLHSRGLVLSIAIVIVLQIGIGRLLVYRHRWLVGSFEEAVALSVTIASSGTTLLIIVLLFLRSTISAGSVLVSIPLCLVLALGGRSLYRFGNSRQRTGVHEPSALRQRAIVFGAGTAGILLVESSQADPDSRYELVAMIDDDPAKQYLRIRNIRVEGSRRELKQLIERRHAQVLIVAVSKVAGEVLREVTEVAQSAGVEVRILPPLSELFEGRVGIDDLRPVKLEDFLGRGQISIDATSVRDLIAGRRVLVTGAGGSIGSEICRQIASYDPMSLIMLERDESALHQVQLSIEGKALLDSRNLVVCDIRDREALDGVFAEHRPEVVFHAAALKHLPLLEMWPAEAIKTNVWGTENVLLAAEASGVGVFVNISTDKAADPISVLGYSKRVAERLTANVGARATGRYLSVRFGNVLGSRGSVLTAFQSQIMHGGPATVTDPDVTRYFMTIAEAVQLTLQAGVLGDDGSALVLEMGDPILIREVAERMIAQSGKPIEIVYTGLRFGEKLHEDLFAKTETVRVPVHPLIMSTQVPTVDERDVADLLVRGENAAIIDSLKHLAVPGTPVIGHS